MTSTFHNTQRSEKQSELRTLFDFCWWSKGILITSTERKVKRKKSVDESVTRNWSIISRSTQISADWRPIEQSITDGDTRKNSFAITRKNSSTFSEKVNTRILWSAQRQRSMRWHYQRVKRHFPIRNGSLWVFKEKFFYIFPTIRCRSTENSFTYHIQDSSGSLTSQLTFIYRIVHRNPHQTHKFPFLSARNSRRAVLVRLQHDLSFDIRCGARENGERGEMLSRLKIKIILNSWIEPEMRNVDIKLSSVTLQQHRNNLHH